MADFDLAFPFVYKNEGGECNVVGDSGGHTSAGGVTQKTLDAFNAAHPDLGFPADVHDLTYEQVGTIYRLDYWKFDPLTSEQCACKILDMDVNDGLPSGVKLAQRAANRLGASLAEDGGFGPATADALNALDPQALMRMLVQVSEEHYDAIAAAHPNDEQFLKGWLNRAREWPNV
jgi:type VI secretion system secreted protein VgrG